MIPWYWLIPGVVSMVSVFMIVRDTPTGDWAGIEIMGRALFWAFVSTVGWALFFLMLWIFA
jgi:predicted neutral ceramidase superfamily lipid hydrolase